MNHSKLRNNVIGRTNDRSSDESRRSKQVPSSMEYSYFKKNQRHDKAYVNVN